MEFKNLECNILDILGESWDQSGNLGPIEINIIYKAFSDIPEENVSAELMALCDDGLLCIHDDTQKLSLTSKGVTKIESLRNCLKELAKPVQKHWRACCV